MEEDGGGRAVTEGEGVSPSGSSVGSCLEVVISLFSGAVRLQSCAHLPPSVAERCGTGLLPKDVAVVPFFALQRRPPDFHALQSIQTITHFVWY